MKETKKSGKKAGSAVKEKESPEDVYAAIGMALCTYFGEQHDKESDVITVKHIPVPTSQWCSKYFNMTNIL